MPSAGADKETLALAEYIVGIWMRMGIAPGFALVDRRILADAARSIAGAFRALQQVRTKHDVGGAVAEVSFATA